MHSVCVNQVEVDGLSTTLDSSSHPSRHHFRFRFTGSRLRLERATPSPDVSPHCWPALGYWMESQGRGRCSSLTFPEVGPSAIEACFAIAACGRSSEPFRWCELAMEENDPGSHGAPRQPLLRRLLIHPALPWDLLTKFLK